MSTSHHVQQLELLPNNGSLEPAEKQGGHSQTVSDAREATYFASRRLSDASDSLMHWLQNTSVGLAVVAGPEGIGKTRFLQAFVSRMTAEPAVVEGVSITFRPIFLSPELLQDVGSIAALVKKIDLLMHQALLDIKHKTEQRTAKQYDAAQQNEQSEPAKPDRSEADIAQRNLAGAQRSQSDWFVLIVDDAARLPTCVFDLLVIHSLMLRPQACLTILADGPTLLARARDSLVDVKHLRRRLQILDLPPFSLAESGQFMRHVADCHGCAVQWSEQQIRAAYRESMGAPGVLLDIVHRYVDGTPVLLSLPPSDELTGGEDLGLTVTADPPARGGRWQKVVVVAMTLSFAVSVWLLAGQMGLVSRVNLPPLFELILERELKLATLPRQSSRLVSEGSRLDPAYFDAWNIWLANFRFDLYGVPPAASSRIANDQSTAEGVGVDKAGGLSGEEGVASLKMFSGPYDIALAMKTLFAWPISSVVIQLDLEHDISLLRGRWSQVEHRGGGIRLILPVLHRGEVSWFLVQGPFNSFESSVESIENILQAQGLERYQASNRFWVRRVSDLQQAVLRFRQAKLYALEE